MNRTIPFFAGALLVMTACESEPATTAPGAPGALFGHGVAGEPADVHRDLAAPREVTAPFHRIESAMAAGWDTRLTPCLENPGVGGMGFHYANVGLLDAEVDMRQPEALLYEPQENGSLRLVAVNTSSRSRRYP